MAADDLQRDRFSGAPAARLICSLPDFRCQRTQNPSPIRGDAIVRPPARRPRARSRAGLRRCGVRPAGGDASRGRTGARGVLRRAGGRHPPGPARARHRLERHPAPPHRPRHRRRAAHVRPPRHGGPRRAGTSAASRSKTRSTRRSSSTGGRPSPSPSTGRPRSSRWPSCAAATSSPARAARWSASTTKCSTRSAIDEAGLPIAGEGALLAALERNRTGRMGDIVATIQAEQDEAIRADSPDRSSSPADREPARPRSRSHRAAYLLYTFRRRLGAQGVLLVGPSPVFLRYIEHVLPSLGEQDVRLSTIAGLRPSVHVRRDRARPRPPRSRATCAWRSVIERAVADRERPLRNDFTLLIDGLQLRCPRGATPCGSIESVQRRRGTHNEQRPHSRSASSTSSIGALQDRGDPLVPARSRRRARRQRHEPLRPRRARSTRASRARSCAAKRCPKVGSRRCGRACAAGPR